MSLILKTNIIGCLTNSFRSQLLAVQIPIQQVVRDYAARKGTREKARKKKVKVEEKKIGFIPHNQRGLDKLLLSRRTKKFDDSWKQIATDNVYPMKYYRWKVYPFLEAVQCHRETHHPSMYNEPNAQLSVIIELNMEGEKKTRFVDNFIRVAAMPYTFEHGEERNILVFAKETQQQEEARNAGAALVGGSELVKDFQNGSLSLQDFQYVLAHPNILPELVVLRGLMKKKFPNPKNDTLTPELSKVVRKFLHGVNYQAKKDEHEKDFGVIQTSIGPLSMKAEHLEANFRALITDVDQAKPKRKGTFIRRCLLISPPSPERLKVDYEQYLKTETKKDEEEDGEELQAAVA